MSSDVVIGVIATAVAVAAFLAGTYHELRRIDRCSSDSDESDR